MSEINRGIPEGVTQKATVINFEAAKEKRLEEKNTHVYWLQERGQHPVKPVESNRPTLPQAFIERDQRPHPEKQRKFNPVETRRGEIQPPAEITNNVIDFQMARENRLINQQNAPASFITPSPIESGKISDSLKAPDFQTDERAHSRKDEEQTKQITDPEEERLAALRLIRSKLAQFDVPVQKRDEIFANLADDPKALFKVAGVVKHLHPQNDITDQLEASAAFRKRIHQALENRQQVDQESEKKLTGFQLTMLLFLSLFTGNIDILFEELEQNDNKEKTT